MLQAGQKGADVPAGPDAVTGVRRAGAPLNRARLGRRVHESKIFRHFAAN